MLLDKEGHRSAVCAKVAWGGSGCQECGGNAHEGICPLGAVNVMQLLEHNLHLLPIGRALGDEMETLHDTNQPFPPFQPDRAAQHDIPWHSSPHPGYRLRRDATCWAIWV